MNIPVVLTTRLAITASIWYLIDGSVDLSIYGALSNTKIKSIDPTLVSSITRKCFPGLGFITCQALNLATDYTNDLSYYQNFNGLIGTNYCLECCGSNRYIDTWELGCTVDKYTAASTNIYGYNAIFAQMDILGSTNLIYCPLKRSECYYNTTTGDLLYCASGKKKTYLHGYILTLNIIENHDNFNFWNGVSSCTAQAIEKNVSLKTGDIFYETLILNHGSASYNLDTSQYAYLSIFIFGVIYVGLYYCRKNSCVVCSNRLVFCSHRCFLCRFYGAKPPDPLLLKALDQKGLLLQGSPPGLFSELPVETVKKRFAAKVHPEPQSAYSQSPIRKPSQDSLTNIGQGRNSILSYWRRGIRAQVKRVHTVVSALSSTPPRQRSSTHPYIVHAAINHPFPPAPPTIEAFGSGVRADQGDDDSDSSDDEELGEADGVRNVGGAGKYLS